jgi:hypothetical protein
MDAWINFTSLPATNTRQTIHAITGSVSGANYELNILNSAGTIYVEVLHGEPGAQTSAYTTTYITSTNTWYHVAGYFATTTARYVWLDGGGMGSSTTTATVSGINNYRIGVTLRTGSLANYFGGKMAEATVAQLGISTAQVAAAADGQLAYRMFHTPTSVYGSLPLWGQHGSTAYNRVNSTLVYTLTGSPSFTSEGPPVLWYPPGRRLQLPPILVDIDLTPTAVAAKVTVNNPTLSFGTATLTPTTVAATAAVADPTVDLGALTMAPTVVAATTAVLDPTLTFGTATLTPTVVAATTAVLDPTVSLGDILVNASVMQTAVAATDPTLTFGTATLSPTTTAATVAVADPSVTFGTLTLSPTAVAATITMAASSLVFGTATLTPTPAAVTATVLDPVATLGDIIVSPTPAAMSVTVLDPTVTASGTVQIDPTSVAAQAAVLDPTVALAATELTPPPVVASMTVLSPTISQFGLLLPSTTDVRIGVLSPQIVFANVPEPTTIEVYEEHIELHLLTENQVIEISQNGPPGPTGAAGPEGPEGPEGPAGPTGTAGPQGTQGPPGEGFLWRGAWNPVVTFNVNDVAMYEGSSYICRTQNQGGWNAADWALLASEGDPGAAGVQGPQGDPGIQGVPGADGSSVLSGIGSPLAGTGADGDFYLRIDTNQLYGPKIAGIWPPTPLELVGPPGPVGADGPPGPQGEAGPAGGTVVGRRIATTTIANTAAWANLISATLPMQVAGSEEVYRVMTKGIFRNNTGSNQVFSVRVTIGGVVLWESPITALSDVDWSVTQIEATLSMQGSATTANMMGRILIGSQATWPSTGQGAMANLSLDAMIGADDTTVTGFDAGTKDFEIDWKWDVADPDASFKAETGYVARL